MFFQTYFLSWIILRYVQRGDYFTLNAPFSILVIILMLLLAWTFALSVGSWGNNMEYLIIPLPASMAIFAVIAPMNLTYGFGLMITSAALLAYDTWRSSKLSAMLIKFEPAIILRFATGGLLLLFSILSGVLLLISKEPTQQINIGRQVSGIVGDTLDAAIKAQIKNTLDGTSANYLQQVDPNITNLLQQFGLPTNLNDPAFTDPQNLGIDTKAIVETQINNVIEPYKDFVKPVMALMLFATFQFYAYITFIIFNITISGLYWVAKKTGFFRIEKIQVEKEVLKF